MSLVVAILTVSDSCAAGTRTDVSGPLLRRHCESLGWTVAHTQIVSDEVAAISQALTERPEQLILTTGGTGISARDVTPEATRRVIEKELPGLGELMRSKGFVSTPRAMLSRAVAGTRARSLIVNLPGTPKGAMESLTAVQELIPHVIELLHGQTSHETSHEISHE